MGFDILVRDFLSFKILTNKICNFLFLSKRDGETKDNTFKFAIKLFYYDFSYIYKKTASILKIKKTLKDANMGKEMDLSNFDRIMKKFDANQQFIENLPLIPYYLLIAFGFASKTPNTKDFSILSRIYKK